MIAAEAGGEAVEAAEAEAAGAPEEAATATSGREIRRRAGGRDPLKGFG